MPGLAYIFLSLALFFVGTAGLLLRRNALFALMSAELQLAAGSLALLTFARGLGDQKGHVLAFFIIALAAAEAAVGLGIIMAVFRTRRRLELETLNELRN
jgi:NADH-quinone oxidoreductase subunit K